MQKTLNIKSALIFFSFLLFASFIHPFHFELHTTYFHDILTIVGLLIAFSYFATVESPRLIFPKILWLPLGLIFMIVMQFLLKIALWPEDLLLPILYFFLVILALIVGATYAAQSGGPELICRSIAIAYLLAALLSVLMQFIQIAGIDAMPFVMTIGKDTQPFMRPYANVAQPNQLALLQCLSFASVWLLYQRHVIGSRISFLLVLVLIIGLVLTQSRIGWIIVPVFCIVSFFNFKHERSINRWFLLMFMAIYALLTINLPTFGQLFGFASGSALEHVGGRSERWVLIQHAWHMILTHPWLGVGWFGFGPEQIKIATDFSAGTYAQHSHNLVLNFAAELGLPAAIIFFFCLTWWLIKCCVSSEQTIVRRFINFIFIALFIHSMVEYPLWYSYFLIPASMLMGTMHQLRWPSEGKLVSPIKILSVFLFSGAILVGVTMSFQRVTLGSDRLRLNSLGYAVDMSPTERPEITFFPQFYDYFRFVKSTVSEGMSEQEIVFSEVVCQRFGYAFMLNKLANIYALNNFPEKALKTLLVLQRLHPYSYSEYYGYWSAAAAKNIRYAKILQLIPKPDA